MAKLDSNEIIKLLKNLIGETTAIGDSAVDEQVEKNLMTLVNVTDWCLYRIICSSRTIGRAEYSMNIIGHKALYRMKEYIAWLEGSIPTDE